MQINIVDDDVLTPIYACGKRGESIDVQVHGVNYTVWKILDNYDRHVGKSSKITCKICHGEKDAFEKLLASLTGSSHAVKEAFDGVGRAARKATSTIQPFMDAFNQAFGKGNK